MNKPDLEDLEAVPDLARQALDRLDLYMTRLTALEALRRGNGKAPARPEGAERNEDAPGDSDRFREGEETPVSPGGPYAPGPPPAEADAADTLEGRELKGAVADASVAPIVRARWWERCGLKAVCAFTRKAGHLLDVPDAVQAARRFERAKHDPVPKQADLADGLRAWIETLAEAAQHRPAECATTHPEPDRLPDAPADAPDGVLTLDYAARAIYLDGVEVRPKRNVFDAFRYLARLSRSVNEVVPYSTGPDGDALNDLGSDWTSATCARVKSALGKAFEAIGRRAFFDAAIEVRRAQGHILKLKHRPILRQGD